MKTLQLFFFLLISLQLTGESVARLKTGFSYGEGFFSELGIANHSFNAHAGFNYSDPELMFYEGYFISPYFSLGSVTYEGFLREHQKEEKTFYSLDERSVPLINKEGNPASSIGMIISLEQIDLYLSARQKQDYTQVLIHKTINIDQQTEWGLTQSISYSEDDQSDDSWYPDKYQIQARTLNVSSLSFLKGSEDLFGGGQFSCSYTPIDPSGYSVLLINGFTVLDLFFQNEIKINSPYFITGDFDLIQYPLLLMTKCKKEDTEYSLISSLIYTLENEPLPWEARLWHLKSDSVCTFYLNRWKIQNYMTFTFFNDEDDVNTMHYSLGTEVAWSRGDFFLEIEAETDYSGIYLYNVSLEGGFQHKSMEFSFDAGVEIDKQIKMNIGCNGQLLFNNINVQTSFSLEEIGLYNCGSPAFKPSFLISFEIQDLGRPKKKAAQLRP
jgi:hypothetical protein